MTVFANVLHILRRLPQSVPLYIHHAFLIILEFRHSYTLDGIVTLIRYRKDERLVRRRAYATLI